MVILRTLRAHWPEYLIEAWALGMFMISAGIFSVAFDYPGSPLNRLIENPDLRRACVGLAMGLTAVALIYSRLGKRSGAHMNPAITLAFLRLGKIAPVDSLFYILAQFAGGLLGVLLVAWLFGAAFEQAPVSFVATRPGPAGPWVAFAAEVLISGVMMFTVLLVSNNARFATATGLFAGMLVAVFITFEAPFSGMSINPARSFASAAPGAQWEALWIYFTAPVLGMLAAAELYCLAFGAKRAGCAKLLHPANVRCIHCGYEPSTQAAIDPPAAPGSPARLGGY